MRYKANVRTRVSLARKIFNNGVTRAAVINIERHCVLGCGNLHRCWLRCVRVAIRTPFASSRRTVSKHQCSFVPSALDNLTHDTYAVGRPADAATSHLGPPHPAGEHAHLLQIHRNHQGVAVAEAPPTGQAALVDG